MWKDNDVRGDINKGKRKADRDLSLTSSARKETS